MSKSIPNTIRKPDGTYHAVKRVPQDLMPHFNKQRLQKSLGTKSSVEARSELPAVLAKWERMFSQLRQVRSPTDAEKRDATADMYDVFRSVVTQFIPFEVRRLRAEAEENGTDIGSEKDVTDRLYDLLLEDIAADMKNAGQADISIVADETIKANGWSIARGTAEYDDLCERLLRGSLEATRHFDECRKLIFDSEVRDPLVIRPSSDELPAPPGASIMELFEEFLSENAKYDRSTKAAYRQAARWFSEFVGEENSVRMAFTRTNAREFKKLLKLAPIRADQAGAFKSLKFPQFIRANESVGKPTISDQRINLILRGCNSFARWLTSHGYIDDSPFVGLTLTINTEGTKYPPFTIEELNTLAQSPVFTGALNEKSIHRPGNVMIRDHRYWLWLLALFTGARLGELGLLVPDDIHEFKGVSVIKMPTEKQRRGGVSIDPRERARPVPVHEELIKCGFIDYAHRMKSAGESKLFPKIKSSSSGDLMGEESKRLNRYLKNIGIKTGDRRVVFHSTRGTFVDAARRGGVRQADYDLLIKLGESTVTRRHYGEELEGTIEQRTEWMSKIKYDKLNLSHLYVP